MAVSSDKGSTDVRLFGVIDIHSVTQITLTISTLPNAPLLRVDMSKVDRLDTAGAWMLTAPRTKYEAAGGVIHPREFRLTALVHHCKEVGLKAVPIVGLMAFLIGVVLAFQGSTQLRQFGAEIFVVDLIAISILRELGILLISIIVAGRTASSLTAAIGSMKMRAEIDAMRTLGLDPAMVLFVPRILALFLVLPILGLIIGVVGCHAGMQVESNAGSQGRMTSMAVVTAIFAVVVADAVFSIFFARLGI